MWPELQAEYGADIQLIQVDRDSKEGRVFAEGYRINYQPAFVVISPTGEVLRAALGPYGPQEVRELVEALAESVP